MRELLEENPGRLLCLFSPSLQQGDKLLGRRKRQAQERGLHGVSSETLTPHSGQRGEAELPELTALPEKCCVSDEGQQLFPGLVDCQPASSKLLLPKAAGSGALGPAACGQRGCWTIWRTLEASGGSPGGCLCALGSLSRPHKPGLRCGRPVVAGVLATRIHTNPLLKAHAHPRGGDGDPPAQPLSAGAAGGRDQRGEG